MQNIQVKWIVPFLVSLSCFGQVPIQSMQPFFKGSGNLPFDFLSISNLYVELFVDSAADWTLSGSQLTWLDRTSYHNDFTNFISPPSISTSTGPGGYGAVHFLTAAGGSGGTVTCVNTLSNQPNLIATVVGINGTSVGQTVMDAYFGSRETFRIGNNANSLFFAGSSVTPDNFTSVSNWYIITAVFKGNNSYLRTNGVLWKLGNVGANSLGHATFGQDLSLVTPFKGYMAAFIAAEQDPSTNDLIAIERALNTKYSLGWTIPGP